MIDIRVVRSMIDSTVGWSQFSTAWCVLYEHLEVRGSKVPDKEPTQQGACMPTASSCSMPLLLYR